jgi:hypothetical protein
MEDMKFIAGNYLYGDLPPGKEYLQHYFGGEVERAFLSYYFTFPHQYKSMPFQKFYQNFCDHSGHCCSTRWVRKLLARFDKIENALKEAQSDITEDALKRVAEIRSGKASF